MPNIIRVEKTKDYFTASNKPFNDNKLSFGARGILSYLFSKPDDWEIRNKDLYSQSPAGRAAVDRMLRELVDNGYMRREKKNDDSGLLYWETVVYEDRRQNPEWDDEKKCLKPKSPNVENRTFGSPNVENPTVELSDVGKPNVILSTERNKVLKSTPNGVSDKSLSEKKSKKSNEPGPRKKLMGAFLNAANMSIPRNKKTEGFWWSQIVDLEGVVNDTLNGDVSRGQQLIADVVKAMRRDKLSIGGPQSIVNLFRDKASARASPNGTTIQLTDEEKENLRRLEVS